MVNIFFVLKYTNGCVFVLLPFFAWRSKPILMRGLDGICDYLARDNMIFRSIQFIERYKNVKNMTTRSGKRLLIVWRIRSIR